MISFDTSHWSSEMLRRRPNAPDAIRAGMELLGTEQNRWQEVADNIYLECLSHFEPLEIGGSKRTPAQIKRSVENIAKAAEKIERELAVLGLESAPLPPNLGQRSNIVQYLHHEIVRALGERLVPPALRENDVSHTLPHRFPEFYWNPNSLGARHSWEGQFQKFADTVQNIAEYVWGKVGTDSLKRPANKTDFHAVKLAGGLLVIFEDETGRAGKAWGKDRGSYPHRKGNVSPFTIFAQAVWPATVHPLITADELETVVSRQVV